MPKAEHTLRARAVVEDYLRSETKANYALLVCGGWGSGKTHMIKNVIGGMNPRPLYVSLYGKSSIAEIQAELLFQMLPSVGGKALQIFKTYILPLLRFFFNSNSAPLNVDAIPGFSEIIFDLYFQSGNQRVLVFDDLERCSLKPKAAMGFINQFVEHRGFKVIALSNEAKIEDKNYAGTKEKIFGRTIKLAPAIEDALGGFIAQSKEANIRKFFTVNEKVIVDIFSRSGSDSLRVLQQSLRDFEKILEGMSTEQLACKNGLDRLLPTFFALMISFKSGDLSESDISKISRVLSLARTMDKHLGKNLEEDNWAKFSTRYPDIQISMIGIEADRIRDLVCHGWFDEERVKAAIDQCIYFSELKAQAGWRTIWNPRYLTDEQFCSALSDVDQKFFNREYIKIGEMLHVFGIKLDLARSGVSGESVTEVVSLCKKYIRDIFESRTLEPNGINKFETIDDYFGYEGLGILEKDSAEFQEIWNFLDTYRLKAKDRSLPLIASVLIEQLSKDPQRFCNRIQNSGFKDSLSNTPILHLSDPSEFLSRWKGLSPANQIAVSQALKARFGNGELRGGLSEELPWIRNLYKCCLETLGNTKASQYLRLLEFTNYRLKPLLEAAKAQRTK